MRSLLFPTESQVRIQLASSTGQSTNPIHIARSMPASQLYTGLSAGLLRQAVYTTARLGLFDTFMGRLKRAGEVGFKERAIAGLSAGGLGESASGSKQRLLVRSLMLD
jgi:solute carrier family 25 oxoglutarate transporter 11